MLRGLLHLIQHWSNFNMQRSRREGASQPARAGLNAALLLLSHLPKLVHSHLQIWWVCLVFCGLLSSTPKYPNTLSAGSRTC